MNKLPMTLKQFEQMLKDYADFSNAAGVETYAEKAYRGQLLDFARAAIAQQEAKGRAELEVLKLRSAAALLDEYNWGLHKQANGYWIRIWKKTGNPVQPTLDITSSIKPTVEQAVLDAIWKLPKETTV